MDEPVVNLVPMCLMDLADAAAAGLGWPERYMELLEVSEDPMLTQRPKARRVFLDEVRLTDPPARWGKDGVWECVDRRLMLRALFWFEPSVPKFAMSNLALYGFSTLDPDHPRNPDFREDTRAKNLLLTQRWDKYTRPKSHTTEGRVYA